MEISKMGLYIAEKRKSQRLTQKALAEKLHVTRQAVSNWECGKSIPDTETLLSMAELFQVKIEDILAGGEPAENAAAEEPKDTAPVFENNWKPPIMTKSVFPKMPIWCACLFLIPAVLLLLFAVLIPFGKIVFYSFTSFNGLSNPDFVGLRNYTAFFQDPLAIQSLGNTIFILLIVVGVTLLLGGLFGSAAAKLPLPVGIGIGVLLGIGALFALVPAWAALLFSGDTYGLLNAWFFFDHPVMWIQQYSNQMQIMLFIMLCLAPSYWIFFIGTRSGQARIAWHVAVTVLPMLIFAKWDLASPIVGHPSADYRANWMPNMIYDYGGIRFELGYSAALTLITVFLAIIFIAIEHLIVWGVTNIFRRFHFSSGLRLRHWIGGGAGLFCGLLFQIPLLLTAFTALKPLEELFLFPPALFPKQPTFTSFVQLKNMTGFHGTYQWDKTMLLFFVITWLCYLAVTLPTAVGIAFLQKRGKTVATACLSGVSLLLPFILTTSLWNLQSYKSLFLSAFYAYIGSPLFPTSVLITAWILKASMNGTPCFSAWMRRRKKLLLTALALLATGAMTVQSLLYATQPLIYNEADKFPLMVVTSLLYSAGIARANVTNAAALVINGVGILLLLLFAAVVIIVFRFLGDKSSVRTEDCAERL